MKYLEDWFIIFIFLLLGSCAVAVIGARIQCTLSGIEAECPHIVYHP